MDKKERGGRMIEVDCRKCKNCTGYSCKIYGNDANKAVKDCANDCFLNYKKKGKKATDE